MRTLLLAALIACHSAPKPVPPKPAPVCESAQESSPGRKWGAVVAHGSGFCDVHFVAPFAVMPQCRAGNLLTGEVANFTTRPDGVTVHDLKKGDLVVFACLIQQ